MIVELERRPRITTDVFVKVGGNELVDIDELHHLFVTLDIGDVAAADIFADPLTVRLLTDLNIIEMYDLDGAAMLSAGSEYSSFRKAVIEACDRDGFDLLDE